MIYISPPSGRSGLSQTQVWAWQFRAQASSLMITLGLAFVLALAIGYSSSLLAAEGQSSQQLAQEHTSEADMWRAVKDGEIGTSSYKVGGADRLINVGGNEGKIELTQFLKPGMQWVVAVIFGAFLLFYLINGPAKLAKGFSNTLVRRWSSADLIIHWTMAVLCLGLILTGLTIMLGRYLLEPFLALGIWSALINFSKTIHDYSGPLFIIVWLMCMIKWMPRQTFKLYDLKWFLVVGGYINFGPFKGKHPDSGFANAGEKLWFWTLAVFGLFISVTGLILVIPAFEVTRDTSMIALLIHAASAVIIIGFTIVHIWMATVLSEGGLECMTSGYCDENWARQHHNLWHDELKESGKIEYKDRPKR